MAAADVPAGALSSDHSLTGPRSRGPKPTWLFFAWLAVFVLKACEGCKNFVSQSRILLALWKENLEV